MYKLLGSLSPGELSSVDFTGREGKLSYDRVYVDEVQEYTQAEIGLFLLVAGLDADSLFLAGDPAQSVVEGVDFRFEEVRSVIHTLGRYGARIERPMKLETNFRSHSGILNVAAFVLDRMFGAYPESALLLPKDEGLFLGPRPCFLEAYEGSEALKQILRSNERLVALTPDENVSSANAMLGAVDLFGIRDAKGLEVSSLLVNIRKLFSDTHRTRFVVSRCCATGLLLMRITIRPAAVEATH